MQSDKDVNIMGVVNWSDAMTRCQDEASIQDRAAAQQRSGTLQKRLVRDRRGLCDVATDDASITGIERTFSATFDCKIQLVSALT